MSATIILAPTFETASAVEAEVTIEAEYGSRVWEGRLYTAAHHQPAGEYAGDHVVAGGRPAPCNDDRIPFVADGIVGISHVDLDTLGGCARALGFTGLFTSSTTGFWKLAGFVDVKGPHRRTESGASDGDLKRLDAWWAWSRINRAPRPDFKDPKPMDVTEYVTRALGVLRDIVDGDEELLAAGRAFRSEENTANENSWVSTDGGVVVRVSPAFTNHLYRDPQGVAGRAVASYNTRTGSITLSLADPVEGVSCRAIVQALWGDEAGGHDGIAGSPRNVRMGFDDLRKAVEALAMKLT